MASTWHTGYDEWASRVYVCMIFLITQSTININTNNTRYNKIIIIVWLYSILSKFSRIIYLVYTHAYTCRCSGIELRPFNSYILSPLASLKMN